MNKIIPLTIIALTATPSFAQSTIEDFLCSDLGQAVGDGVADAIEESLGDGYSVEIWMCDAMKFSKEVDKFGEDFRNDLTGYTNLMSYNWYGNMLSVPTMDEEKMQEALGNIMETLKPPEENQNPGTPGQEQKIPEAIDPNKYRDAVQAEMMKSLGGYMSFLLESELPEEPAEMTPAQYYAANVRSDPELLSNELSRLATQYEVGSNLAQSMVNTQRSNQTIEAILNDTSVQASVDAVINQDTGTAADLAKKGQTAISSRAALQYIIGGMADYMSQEAVQNAQIIEAIRTQTIQEARTTSQLTLLTQQVGEIRLQETEQKRRELEQLFSNWQKQTETSVTSIKQKGDLVSVIHNVEEIKKERVNWETGEME
jgi:hypothetical protein